MTAKQAELAARYGVEPIYPEYETFPSPELFPPTWAVRQKESGRALDTMRWGFARKVPGSALTR